MNKDMKEILRRLRSMTIENQKKETQKVVDLAENLRYKYNNERDKLSIAEKALALVLNIIDSHGRIDLQELYAALKISGYIK